MNYCSILLLLWISCVCNSSERYRNEDFFTRELNMSDTIFSGISHYERTPYYFDPPIMKINKLTCYYINVPQNIFIFHTKWYPIIDDNYKKVILDHIFSQIFSTWLKRTFIIEHTMKLNKSNFTVEFSNITYGQSRPWKFITKNKDWYIDTKLNNIENNLRFRLFHNVAHMLGLGHLLPLYNNSGNSIMTKKPSIDYPSNIDFRVMRDLIKLQYSEYSVWYSNNNNVSVVTNRNSYNITKIRFQNLLLLKNVIDKILQSLDYLPNII